MVKYKPDYKPRSYVVELLKDEISDTEQQKQTQFVKGYKMGLKFALALLNGHKD